MAFRCPRFRALTSGLILLLSLQLSATADELRENSIIGKLPAQTPFVAISRLHKQQFNAIAKHPAVQKLLKTKAFQQAWNEFQAPETNETSSVGNWLNSTETGRETRDLILDAISHELFVYGDASWLDAPEAFHTAWKSLSDLSAKNQDLSENERSRQSLKALKAIPDEVYDKIQLPNLVFGAHLSNPDRAHKLFAQLKTAIDDQLTQNSDAIPALYSNCYQVQTIGDTEYLTLEIPGRWIPLHFIDRSKMTRANEEFLDFIIDGLHRRTFKLAIGVQGNHLICSLGGSFAHLKQLESEDVLLDHPKLAKIKELSNQPISSIVYVSEEFSRIGWSENPSIEGYENYATDLLSTAKKHDGVSRILYEQAAEDVVEFGKDMLNFHTTPGAKLQFNVLVNAGVDQYIYDWSEHSERDATKPLDILNHVGGDPLLVIAGHKTYRPEFYEFRSKWLSRALWYGPKIISASATPENANAEFMMSFEMFRQMFRPTLVELDEVTRNLWIPAFQDGQSALVIDVSDLRKEPHRYINENFQLYPYLPQLGFVCKISDREKLIEACDRYCKTFNQLLLTAGAVVAQGEGKPFQIPAPAQEKLENGTLFWYDMTQLTEDKIDDEGIPLLPVAAVSDHLAVIASDRSIVNKILKSTPLSHKESNETIKQSLSCYVYADFDRLWQLTEDPLHKLLASQVKTNEITSEKAESTQALMEIIFSLKSFSSTTSHNKDAWITHSKLRFSGANENN